jgi:hypothetical protein
MYYTVRRYFDYHLKTQNTYHNTEKEAREEALKSDALHTEIWFEDKSVVYATPFPNDFTFTTHTGKARVIDSDSERTIYEITENKLYPTLVGRKNITDTLSFAKKLQYFHSR